MFTNFIIWLNEHGIEASDDTIISERLNFLKESESKNYYDKIIDFETETKIISSTLLEPAPSAVLPTISSSF